MAELFKVSKAMFSNRKDWSKITDLEKEECFFIFNRYFSKKFPMKSQLLNDKLQDKSVAMNLWYHFMENQPYPDWFWAKTESKQSKSEEYTEKEIKELLFNLEITMDELNLLIKWYGDLIKEELKFYKDVAKGNRK